MAVFPRKREAVVPSHFLRGSANLPLPPRSAILHVSLLERWRLYVDAILWLRNATTIREIIQSEVLLIGAAVLGGLGLSWLAGGPQLLAALAPLGIDVSTALMAVATVLGLLSVLFPYSLLFAGGLLTAFLASLSLPGAGWWQLGTLLDAGRWTAVHAYLMILGSAWAVRMLASMAVYNMRDALAHKDDKRSGSKTLSLSFQFAKKVTNKFKDICQGCFRASLLDNILSIKDDRETPYRILRGLLPVNPLFFRRPRNFQKVPLKPGTQKYARYRETVDICDALSAGILGLIGAPPQLRYVEESNEQLAQDRFWVSDEQELNDTGTSTDIFMRFHQSTVERDFPPKGQPGEVSTYRVYAGFNNFRRMPIFLLKVTDVVDVLYGRHPSFSRAQQEKIYDGLSVQGGDHAMELLCSSRFAKQTARAERYRKEAQEPLGKPIFAYAGEDKSDVIMSFDPGRVWPAKDAPVEYMDAVIALRGAIHVASRRSAIQVVVKRRDLLVIDNLRVMVGRREDRISSILQPLSWLQDGLLGWYEPLSTRWLRLIYGFPPVQTAQEAEHAALVDEMEEMRD